MSDQKQDKPKLVIISGPSGVGKSTICHELLNRIDAILSVSDTTRTPGQGETSGKDYNFLSQEQFDEKVKTGQFLEHAEVFGHNYGTPKEPVEQALKQGKNVILEIDVQGARMVKQTYPDALMIFILPPSQSDLVGRMTARARGENADIARLRLNSAGREIAAAWQYYEYMVINADVNQAVEEIIQIIHGNVEKDK